MNAAELKAKARERLAEIAREREALAVEERELRVMLGEPAPTITITSPFVIQYPDRETAQPMVRPMPYDVRPIATVDGLVPNVVIATHWTSEAEATNTTGCTVHHRGVRIGAEHSTPDEAIVYGAAS